MARKREMVSIEDFEDVYGADTMDKVLMEHLLVEREQAKRFREIENIVFDKDITIAQIRSIVESESE